LAPETNAFSTSGESLSTITFPVIDMLSKINASELLVVYLHQTPEKVEKVCVKSVAPPS